MSRVFGTRTFNEMMRDVSAASLSFGWLLAFAGAVVASAQAQQACTLPAEVAARQSSLPVAQRADFAGSWFASHKQARCAVLFFQDAVKTAPGSVETRYHLALALLDMRQLPEAARQFELVAQATGTAAPQLGLGLALQEMGNLNAAEAHFRIALDLDGKSVPALQHLGEVLTLQKRYTAAIVYFRKAAEFEPANAEHQVSAAEAIYDNGSAAEAIQLLEKTVAAQPRSFAAQSNLGTLLAREKRYSESLGHFRAALAIDATDEATVLSLVKALIGLGRDSEAIPLVSPVIARAPRNFEARYLRGLCYRGVGSYANAVSDLRIAVAENPNHYSSQYNLGSVLLKLNQLEDARLHLLKARELDPGSQEAQFQLAIVLRKLNQSDVAKKQLAELEESKRHDQIGDRAGTTANRANQALIEGNGRAAVAGYLEALQLDPKNAKTYYNLALAQLKLDESAAALLSLEKSVALDPAFAAARSELGMLYLNTNRDAEAEKQFNAGLKADPQCFECENNLGVLYGRRGDTSRAVTYFRQAVENKPDYGQARVNLALTLAERSEFTAARHELDTILAAEPQNLKALTTLGMIQARANDPEAVSTFQKIVSLDGNSFEAHLNLGIALADAGHPEKALAEFTEAARLGPEVAATRYNRGRALVQMHRYREAVPELQHACKLNPAEPDAWYRLGIAFREQQDFAHAVDALEKAVNLTRANSEMAFLLGQSYQSLGKMSEAAQAWKKALDADGTNKQALYSLMRATVKSDPAASSQYASRLSALQNEHGQTERAETLANFAIAAGQKGNWDDAVAQLQEAIRVCGQCTSGPKLRKNLGLIECQAGRFEACGTELRSALKEMPDDTEILKALEILHNIGLRTAKP